MHSKILRILGGALGIAFLVVAIPISRTSPESFWPPWVIAVTYIGCGLLFLNYAISGPGEVHRRDDSEPIRSTRFLAAVAAFILVATSWLLTSGELDGGGVVEAGILAVAFVGVGLALWIWVRSGRMD